ncbi:MAG: hypothetical protein ACI85U_002129 [Candidatus Promineifilaceae bacterium]|jgi:hypothetical protein
MSFKQKSIVVTLVNFSLILIFLLIRIFQFNQNGEFTSTNIFRLWGITIGLAIIVSIIGIIMTQIASSVIESIVSGGEEPELDFFEDERDNLIDLKGAKMASAFSSIGVLLAMLTFVFGHPPLVMFTLLILFGIVAQIAGDITRLVLYQRGLE